MSTATTYVNDTFTAMSASTTASGVAVTISGLLDSNKFGIVYQNTDGLAGALAIGPGEYLNTATYTKTTASGLTYIFTDLDGTKYRNDDGTVTLTSDTVGRLYSWVY